MSKIAIFPGSFDPFTVGHEEIVRRGLALFDKIIIAVGYNSSKQNFFSIDKRLAMITKVFSDEPRVEINRYEELTIDYCKKVGARFIIRGLRTAADFEFERAIGQANRHFDSSIETVFLLTAPEHSFISSSIIRDILYHKGDASSLLPQSIDINDYL